MGRKREKAEEWEGGRVKMERGGGKEEEESGVKKGRGKERNGGR